MRVTRAMCPLLRPALRRSVFVLVQDALKGLSDLTEEVSVCAIGRWDARRRYSFAES
jgi:hypothetical protein